MYIRYDQTLEDHGIFLYFQPFSKRLWWAIIIFILVVGGFTLAAVYTTKSDFGILNAFFHPFEAFLNQGNRKLLFF